MCVCSGLFKQSTCKCNTIKLFNFDLPCVYPPPVPSYPGILPFGSFLHTGTHFPLTFLFSFVLKLTHFQSLSLSSHCALTRLSPFLGWFIWLVLLTLQGHSCRGEHRRRWLVVSWPHHATRRRSDGCRSTERSWYPGGAVIPVGRGHLAARSKVGVRTWQLATR